MYLIRSRYYNPKTARFLTEDTASGKYNDPLSLNKYTYCHNQPVTQDDPTGHWAHIVAGAVIGGLIGGGISYASQAIKNKSFTKGINWKKVAGAAAEGAVTGAIGAATGGASFAAKSVAEVGVKTATKQFVKKAAVDVGANFVGNTANQLISKGSKNYSLKEAVVAGASGIASTVGEYGVHAAKKAGSMAVAKVAEKIGSKAGNKAAAEAGSQVASKTLMSSETAGMASAGAEAIGNSPLASFAKTGAGEADDSAANVLMKESGAGKEAITSASDLNSVDIGNGKQYSVMYEASVGKGKSRSAHRNAANKQFYNRMKKDSEFRKNVDDYFGYDVMEHMKSGKRNLKNPSSDWVWHHSADNPDAI